MLQILHHHILNHAHHISYQLNWKLMARLCWLPSCTRESASKTSNIEIESLENVTMKVHCVLSEFIQKWPLEILRWLNWNEYNSCLLIFYDCFSQNWNLLLMQSPGLQIQIFVVLMGRMKAENFLSNVSYLKHRFLS